MSKLLFSILFSAFFISANAGSSGPGDSFTVKTSESTIEWTARKVTGKHNGSITIKEGSLKVNDGVIESGSFTIDMTSIAVLDLQGNGKTKLENHLRSDDFFSVEKFPTASFVITGAKAKGSGQYDIKGDLTIKGITHPIEFPAQVKSEGKSVVATANIVVDRTLYNIRYGSGKFFDNLGDSTIYDEFELAITLVAE